MERQCRHRLAYEPQAVADEQAREKVLVVDLSLRNPLNEDFAAPLLRKLLGQPEIVAAARADAEGDLAWNLRHLGHAVVQRRLARLYARLVAGGHRATVRELLIWTARLLLGRGQDDKRPVRSAGRWYASRLFEKDERFALSGLMLRLADPAAHSHPRWDWHLETNAVTAGWHLDGAPVLMHMDTISTDPNYLALKRRFYFEHERGEEVLDLDGHAGDRLIKVLIGGVASEVGFKEEMIEAINRAYCTELFPAMSTSLYLWIGHRYHEQPSHGHVANQRIDGADLELLMPRLPARLAGAFAHQPDHLLLRHRPSRISLRVDYALFAALEKLRHGLPRQLLPDRELNRLDVFIERLRRLDLPVSREFFIHSHDSRTTIAVTLSSDLKKYEAVRTSAS